jgi:tRNA pseudouridine55 synthase
MKRAGSNVAGVLLLDKPAGLSSNAALGRARRLFGGTKAGHTGTLDPFATGLLPIAMGEASKYSRFLLDATKGYSAVLKLGETSSTGDPEGEILRRRPVDVSPDRIRAVLADFHGDRQQIPPMYSALKRDGVPLYKLARQGVEVERAPRDITILELQLLGWDGVDRLAVHVLCTKGTYIRVLAEDIGEALGCGAYLIELRRTRTGSFNLDQAVTLDALEAMPEQERRGRLLSVDALAGELPQVSLAYEQAQALSQGKIVSWDCAVAGEHRAYGPDGRFLGIVEGGRWGGEPALLPVRMMSPEAAGAVTG